MKKLKLNLSNLKGAEVLSREQLKKVIGGDYEYGGGCSTHCYAWNSKTVQMDYLTCTYIPGNATLPGSCVCPRGTGSCS